MECKWGRTNCKNLNSSCDACLIEDHFYSPVLAPWERSKKKTVNKQDNRMGSRFEYQNHKNNEALVSTDMTLNSGATAKEKGDEQIRGIIRIMEELKTHHTKNKGRQPGKETFTIRKEWLNKLNKEAKEANKEFWYLKFAFKNEDNDHYIIVESDIIMSMVKTMIEDRKKAKLAKSEIDIANKKSMLKEVEAAKLFAEKELLEARIRNLECQLNIKNGDNNV